MSITALLKNENLPAADKPGKTTSNPLQLKAAAEENELLPEQTSLQLKSNGQNPLQQKGLANNPLLLATGKKNNPLQKTNNTGLPDNLKTGVEALSGYSVDDVKVHYNSDKPAQLQALAYARGSEIHIGPGQEKHLPHEAWHVIQQKQGRVQPTIQAKEGIAINDDRALEKEADVMGARAVQMKSEDTATLHHKKSSVSNNAPVQRLVGFELETSSGLTPGNDTPALQKDKALIKGQGWSLTVEVADGEKVIEFKVHAIDDQANPRVLQDNMDHLKVFVDKLVGYNEVTVDELATATGTTVADVKFKNVVIRPNENPLTARPQMTAGISLDRITHLLNDMSSFDTQLMMGNDPGKRVTDLQSKISGANFSIELSSTPKNYQGFISLLSTYIFSTRASGRLSYFKAGVPALSRADLGLFINIPEIQQRKSEILKDVLNAVELQPDDLLIPGGTYNDKKQPIAIDTTIKTWVEEIIKGNDIIPWSLQVNQEGKAFELEDTGPKKEGQQRKKGVPIEVRALESNIPHTLWGPFMVHLFKYVQVLNSDNPAAYSNMIMEESLVERV